MRPALASVAALAGLALPSFAQSRAVEGKPDSPVRVLIYEDLQCPDCAAFRRMMDEKLLPRFGNQVAFEHRDFPLAKHAWARRAAIAARFFEQGQPGLGIEYRRHTMANIAQTTDAGFEQRLREFAARHGVDPERAAAALRDDKLAALVEKDYQDGVARGVARTPTVFVDGRPYIETFTFDEIAKGIAEALAQAR